MTRARVLVLPVFLLMALPLSAQEDSEEVPELVTDRPDQTESSAVVPPGFVQIESGWLLTRQDEEDFHVRTQQFPDTLVRLGVVRRVELRLGWSGYHWLDARGAVRAEDHGAGDAFVGTKLYLRPEAEGGWLPEAALLAGAEVPTGEDPFSSERVDPSFRLSFSHTLHERVAVGYNLGMVWASDVDETGDRDTLSTYLYTLAFGFALTDRLGAFTEFFGDLAASADARAANSFDGGLTYLLRPNLQLDAFAGVGLSSAADDWFVGAGVSFRLPR